MEKGGGRGDGKKEDVQIHSLIDIVRDDDINLLRSFKRHELSS